MKAEFKNGILTLRSENEEEEKFLRNAFQEGARVFGGGSYYTLALPSMAKLKQFDLTSDQITMLVYALGKTDSDLRRAYGDSKVESLLFLFAFKRG